MDEKSLIGKEIKEIEVDGYHVYMKFTDNTIFAYDASDAGYSAWDIIDGNQEVKHAHWVNGICTNCGVEKPVVRVYRGFDEIVYQYKGELDYCPNCGAKMDEEE